MPRPRGGHTWRTTMKRKPVNKHASARQFKRNVSRTKAINVRPLRGGYRL